MKRFFIDTYRIFLLQTSKVLWDIIGWTLFIWFIFYLYATNFGQTPLLTMFAGIFFAIRLYYIRGRKRLEEVETLRPATPFAKEISNFLVLFLFFVLVCGVTSFLFYNLRLARFIIWFKTRFTGYEELMKYSYYLNMDNSIKEITPEILEDQKLLIKSALGLFWYYSIPAAVAAKLKLIPRIIFLVILVILFFFVFRDVRSFVDNSRGLTFQIIFYSFYLLMFVYLIIPKRTNFFTRRKEVKKTDNN